jgi:hypothetical protein
MPAKSDARADIQCIRWWDRPTFSAVFGVHVGPDSDRLSRIHRFSKRSLDPQVEEDHSEFMMGSGQPRRRRNCQWPFKCPSLSVLVHEAMSFSRV